MSAYTICQRRDWARFYPSSKYLWNEAEDIYVSTSPSNQLYANERIADVLLTHIGSWELYTLRDAPFLVMNSFLMREYSLMSRFLGRLRHKWSMIGRKMESLVMKSILFRRWRGEVCPMVSKMTQKQKRYMRRRQLVRAFRAWSLMVHPPSESGRWSIFPRTCFKLVNDLSSHYGLIAISSCPERCMRDICSFCKKSTGRSGPVLYFPCGHAIHENCFPIRGVHVHDCPVREAGLLTECPLPNGFLIQVHSGSYILDRDFQVIGPRGNIWHVSGIPGMKLKLSELFSTPPDTHIWGILRGISKWRRQAMLIAERQRFAISYIHIHLTQVAWNEYATDVQKMQMRLRKVHRLSNWRQKVGQLAHIVNEFCQVFQEQPNMTDPTGRHALIRADLVTFEKMYEKLMNIFVHLFGRDSMESVWMNELGTYATDKFFDNIKMKQNHFQALIRETLYYVEQLILKTDSRINLDRGLDPIKFPLSVWGLTFYRIGFTYLSDGEQQALMRFVLRYRNKLSLEVGSIRFAFKWNTQTVSYKSIHRNTQLKDDLIYQVGEVSSFDIKHDTKTPIHFVSMGMDKAISLIERNTKLPLWKWIQRASS